MSRIPCILYPPGIDFYYMFQRPQQLMKSFSELNILSYFINRPYLYHFRPGIQQLNPCFYLFNQIDIHRYLKDLRPVIYFSSPDDIDNLAQYNPSLIVFDSVDEPSEEFACWQKNYERALRSADIVLASSDKLHAKALAYNQNAYLIPNGCDYDFFSGKTHKIPEDIRHMEGPIIGYSGAITSWCDLELIEQAAINFPHCNIVMIGPLYNISNVPLRSNLHWLGIKPYRQLPSYLQRFDVGIIPFKRSSMVDAVNPIKMWEYMASGLPVVTTAIPEVKKYPELILCAETEAAFMENLNKALFCDTEEKRVQRMELAQQNSWTARAQKIVSIIEERLEEKGVKALGHMSVSTPTVTPGLPRPNLIKVTVKRSASIRIETRSI